MFFEQPDEDSVTTHSASARKPRVLEPSQIIQPFAFFAGAPPRRVSRADQHSSMKFKVATLVLCSCGALLAATAFGQTAASVPATTSGQAIASVSVIDAPVAATPIVSQAPGARLASSNWYQAPNWRTLDAVIRGRWEATSGIGFVPGASDSYDLHRVRLGLGVKPTVPAECRDGRATDGSSSPSRTRQ